MTELTKLVKAVREAVARQDPFNDRGRQEAGEEALERALTGLETYAQKRSIG